METDASAHTIGLSEQRIEPGGLINTLCDQVSVPGNDQDAPTVTDSPDDFTSKVSPAFKLTPAPEHEISLQCEEVLRHSLQACVALPRVRE